MAITIALAGNPNCGKTTLFNALTGANQYVGNWPGVTVEKKEGKLKKHDDVTITDLPGIYSLSPYTLEEVVARNYLVGERPDAVLNIIDGTNLERNLYLTTQILELGVPVVLAVNMMDLVRKSGDKINIKTLGQELGCKVVEISALKQEGITEAAEAAIAAAKAGKIAPKHAFSGPVEHCIAHIEEALLHDQPEEQQRWYAVKVFENDEKVIEQLNISADKLAHVKTDIAKCEEEMDDDAESIITNERYVYIAEVIKGCYVKARKGQMTTSDKIDRVVTNRFLALPLFILIMGAVYFIVCWDQGLGVWVTDFTNDVIVGEWIQAPIQAALENAGASEWVVSLVVDGIIGGLGAPVGFAPQMAIMFFLLSILEDCGYMARVAFIMDRIFRRFGLSGRSFITFLISSSCGVPAIMSTRTIENEKDRNMTMTTTTFVPCGAKLPVIALLAGVMVTNGVDEKLWWVAPAMYFIGFGSIIISCIILKKFRRFAGEPAPFVMELPQYHVPSWKGVLLHTWERVWAFLKKAGTILFVCCVVMWFLATFGVQDGAFGMVDSENSLLAILGGAIAWIFAPLGFGTWQAVAASLSGFVAKEGIVSTMGVLSSLAEEVEEYDTTMHDAFSAFFTINGVFNPVSAFAFLCFNLLDSPCLAAISTLAREMGNGKHVAMALVYQNLYSYCITLIIYNFGMLFLYGTFSLWTVVAAVVLVVGLYLLFRKDPTKAGAKVTA